MTNLLSDFAAAVARHPDRVAIVDGKGRETRFAQLMTRTEALARAWHMRGIRKGDRVLLAMRWDADLYAALAALWSLGATVVLPEPAMGLAGLRHAAKLEGVSAFCSSGAFGVLKFALPELWPLRHLRPTASRGPRPDLPAPQAEDIALISFTSGTSGLPKAIPRSHGFLDAQHHAIAPMLHSDTPERDLVCFPVFVLINIASGRTSVLPDWKMSRLSRVKPAALAGWMARQSVTRALMPPSLCEKLAEVTLPTTLHSLFTGGGPVFPDLMRRLTAGNKELRLVCVYGSTEAEPIAHLDAIDISAEDQRWMTEGKGLLVGHPVAGLALRVVEDEIQVAGAHVNSGYLDPAHDVENKVHEGGVIWHRTGDAGHVDAQGRLWLLGRSGTEVDLPQGPRFPFPIEVAARGWKGVTGCALIETGAGACLVVEGDARCLADWQAQAARLGIAKVKQLANIPMDKRHASKIDRAALARLVV
ncbi:AMP-binding protein [Pseudorhodobacter aquimaris]|uniref:AMP-binding protein n=1 Tax=Pseudorhodobacter aquimaris TaxID=687412 RepID=UPI00067CE37D|nr:AMP-binding protein [Pseudorhodobacter aquimaris]